MTLSKRAFRRMVEAERTDNSLKTAHMFRLEIKFKCDIYELLDGAKSGIVVAKELGVTTSCVSKWRKKLSIEVLKRQCYICSMSISYASKTCPYCGGAV